MHIHALDSYQPGSSSVHRLDPRIKLVLTVLTILTAALTAEQSWLSFVLLEALLLLVVTLSGVGHGRVQRRSMIVLPFSLAALTVVFATPGRVLWTLPGLSWGITDAGLWRFLSIVARSYLSIQAAVLLAAVTPFPDLLWAARALRVPPIMVAIGGFLYRYLFVLADEAQRMMRARMARSTSLQGRHHGGTLVWRARVAGAMVGSLFIRSYERSERIYNAMLTRGYDGTIRTLSPPALRLTDVAAGLLTVLFLLAVLALARLGSMTLL